MEREAVEGVHDAADLELVRGQAAERARLRAVRMDDIETPEADPEVSEGAAVVGGGDLAAQVRHQHDFVARVACLRNRVIGALAGDEHDLEALRIQRERAAQRHPASTAMNLVMTCATRSLVPVVPLPVMLIPPWPSPSS